MNYLLQAVNARPKTVERVERVERVGVPETHETAEHRAQKSKSPSAVAPNPGHRKRARALIHHLNNPKASRGAPLRIRRSKIPEVRN